MFLCRWPGDLDLIGLLGGKKDGYRHVKIVMISKKWSYLIFKLSIMIWSFMHCCFYMIYHDMSTKCMLSNKQHL